MAEGVYELPDGRFHPPMGLRCVERQFKTRVKDKLGWTMTLGRSANLTKPLNGRQPCHYCGPCERGCVTHSYFNSAFTTVADALKTGHCTLVTNAMAYKVLMDPVRHRARGVLYVDRVTREPREVYARAVVLCAQASSRRASSSTPRASRIRPGAAAAAAPSATTSWTTCGSRAGPAERSPTWRRRRRPAPTGPTARTAPT